MGDLFGICGSTHYLMNRERSEAYAFDSFGEGIGPIGFISAYSNVVLSAVEADILSILGTTNDSECEIFLNGRVLRVEKNYLEVYSDLSRLQDRVSHLVYRISHPERCNQLLIPFKKGSIRDGDLDSGTWVNC